MYGKCFGFPRRLISPATSYHSTEWWTILVLLHIQWLLLFSLVRIIAHCLVFSVHIVDVFLDAILSAGIGVQFDTCIRNTNIWTNYLSELVRHPKNIFNVTLTMWDATIWTQEHCLHVFVEFAFIWLPLQICLLHMGAVLWWCENRLIMFSFPFLCFLCLSLFLIHPFILCIWCATNNGPDEQYNMIIMHLIWIHIAIFCL